MNPYLIDQVTRILASYQGMTPGLAAEMLAYHGFTQQLLAIERKVQQEISEIREDEITGDPQTYIEKMAHRISMEEIAKVVESTALLIAEKKEQERARAAYELTAVQKELKQVTSSLHLLQEKQEALKSDLEAKTNTIADLEETSATTADDMRALSAQTASAHTQIERLSKSFLVAKWLLGMCIGLIGIGIVEPLLNGVIVQNNLALSSPIRFFVYLSSMSLGLVVGLGLRRFWKVFSVLETILSLITILWAITMLSGR
jgi:septal ring factor EnvC (AmiA/AmiB activator)